MTEIEKDIIKLKERIGSGIGLTGKPIPQKRLERMKKRLNILETKKNQEKNIASNDWVTFHGMRKAHKLSKINFDTVCGLRMPIFGWIIDNEKEKCLKCIQNEKKWGKND